MPLPISVAPANGFLGTFGGGTPNQKAVAYSLDHLDMNSDSANLLINLIARPLSSIPAALDLIAPEEYGTASEISRSAARMTATMCGKSPGPGSHISAPVGSCAVP